MRVGFAAIDLREARELRMLNPRYAGTDRLGRPFVVTAAVGRQDPSRQDLMSLDQPRGEIVLHSGGTMTATGLTGIYQSGAQILDLFEDINLVHTNGTRFVTQTARLDLAHDTAEGHDPVEGHGPSGDIEAQGFQILDKGVTILFLGKSDLLLQGAHPGTAPAQPPQLPVAVANTATAAAAQPSPPVATAKPQAATIASAPPSRPGQAAKHAARARSRRTGNTIAAHASRAAPQARPAAKKAG
jgi:hypothetical protein